MTTATKQELTKHLADLVQAAYDALNAAEAFADEHKLSFNFSPAYGMGGSYDGEVENRSVPEYVDREDHDGWYPSSQSC